MMLIVMISLSIHTMTAQGQWLANRLKWNHAWIFPRGVLMEKTYGTRAHTVRKVFLNRVTWDYIWMFTAVSTNALNVESVFKIIAT